MQLIAELSNLCGGGDVEADNALENKRDGRASQVRVHVFLPVGRHLVRDSLALSHGTVTQASQLD